MNSFTLDHTCLVALSHRAAEAEAIETLIVQSRRDVLRGHVTACGTTAALREAGYPATYREFVDWLRLYRMDHLSQAYGIMRWGPSFWNAGVWGDDAAYARERRIYGILHPADDYEWSAAVEAAGADPEERSGPAYEDWRGRVIEAQAVWAHEHVGARTYVTTDADLARRMAEGGLGGRVLSPAAACATLLPDG